MKRLILILLIFFPITINAQISKGTWYWKSKDRNNNLELTITSRDNQSLKGNYCSVFDQGNKIDCSSELEDQTNFILKQISDNIFQGTFTSNYSFKKGILKIIFNPLNNNIKLEIIEVPKGEFYLPKNAVLSQL